MEKSFGTLISHMRDEHERAVTRDDMQQRCQGIKQRVRVLQVCIQTRVNSELQCCLRKSCLRVSASVYAGIHPPWKVHLPGRYTPLAGTPPWKVHSRQVHTPLAGRSPSAGTPPPPHDNHSSGRYASCWNAFLLLSVSTSAGNSVSITTLRLDCRLGSEHLTYTCRAHRSVRAHSR